MSISNVRVEMDRTWVLSVGVSLAAPYVYDTIRPILQLAKSTAPRKTGRLAGSLQTRMIPRRTYVAGRVETNVKYAHYVHNGTRPHRIQATRAGALVFQWQRAGVLTIVPRNPRTKWTGITKAGVLHIGKGYVNHPGTKANPWLYRATRRVAERRGFIVSIEGPLAFRAS